MPSSGSGGERLRRCQGGRIDLSFSGHRPCSRHPARKHRPLCLGCRRTTSCSGARAAWARARWSRRCTRASTQQRGVSLKLVEIHREDIETLPELLTLTATRRTAHPVLRRPFLRSRRYRLQIAEGGARGRGRGPAGERAVLCDLQPPASAAAQHDGERALNRDQSIRGGRGEGIAVGPLRPLARLPQMQPGRLPGDGRAIRAITGWRSPRGAAAREALEWATTRGARSGRVAWQFVQDLAGRLGVALARGSGPASLIDQPSGGEVRPDQVQEMLQAPAR